LQLPERLRKLSTCGVGQWVWAAVSKFMPPLPRACLLSTCSALLVLSVACGVGHRDPIDAVSSVRRVDGASRYVRMFGPIAFAFQISADSVEPIVASLSCNLLTHDCGGATLSDETKEVWPQMPLIVNAGSLARD